MIKKILKRIVPNFSLFFYKKFNLFFKYLKFKLTLNYFRILNKNISIIVGAGDTKYNSWIATDYPYLDITDLENIKKNFKNKEVAKILAEHVFEHLTLEDGIKSIINLKFLLKSKGTIRIAVPDGYNPNEQYINRVKPGGTGAGSDDHKILYNYKSIIKLFDEDFKIELLEYFNENGKFVFNSYENNQKNGYIVRSRFNDIRNTKNKINYNSIILEAKLLK